jgi:alpha-ketoglutarate-dependent taurine dioxygenase
MASIRAAYDRCRTRFSWATDDVMLCDNLRVCHGREPFTGARKVLVSMSDPADYSMFGVPTTPAAGR